jgi:carbon monoxide dehydrogenase subunit G
MKITNEFTVHTPIDQAWKLLTDLEAIAPCMPGAALTGVEGDTYKGKVKVKVGPVISEFAGTARFTEKSDEDYRAAIDAKGRDARSGGNAAAVVTAVLHPSGAGSTTVSVETDLKITGKLAQFGSGMIKEVSSKLLAQFVTNLEAKLATETASPEPEAAPEASAAPRPAPVAAEGATAASAAAVGTVPETAVSPAAISPATSTAANGSAPGSLKTSAPASINGSVPAPLNGSAQAPSAQAPSAPAPSAQAPAVTPAPVAPRAAASSPPANAEEPEPLDLLSIAGSSVYKRLIPVAVVVVVIGAIITWLVRRN